MFIHTHLCSPPELPSHGKASLQTTGITVGDKKNDGGMKLITIEEPEKSILEPVSEVAESPPPMFTQQRSVTEPTLPLIVENEDEVESTPKHALPEAPKEIPPESKEVPPEGTPEGKDVKKSPLTRKRSGRIRTKSKVETAL